MGLSDDSSESPPSDGDKPLPAPWDAKIGQPPQTPVFRATHSARYQRQDAIKQLESVLEHPLICYVASSDVLLTRSDVVFFADLVHDLVLNEDLYFLISCSGGDVDAAYRAARVIRAAVGEGRITAIVPSSATSAATLLTLVSDKIVMSDTSELGPIDPLLVVPTAIPGSPSVRRSALAYQAAFDEAIRRASDPADPQREVWSSIAHDFDQSLLLSGQQAVARTRDYADKLLREGMFRDGGIGSSGSSWTQVSHNLMVSSRFSGHGAVISHTEAETIGLEVQYLRRSNDMWQAFWRLYCLQQVTLEAGESLLEGSRVSLHRTAQG